MEKPSNEAIKKQIGYKIMVAVRNTFRSSHTNNFLARVYCTRQIHTTTTPVFIVIDSINSLSLKKITNKKPLYEHNEQFFCAVDMAETIDKPELIIW